MYVMCMTVTALTGALGKGENSLSTRIHSGERQVEDTYYQPAGGRAKLYDIKQ